MGAHHWHTPSPMLHFFCSYSTHAFRSLRTRSNTIPCVINIRNGSSQRLPMNLCLSCQNQCIKRVVCWVSGIIPYFKGCLAHIVVLPVSSHLQFHSQPKAILPLFLVPKHLFVKSSSLTFCAAPVLGRWDSHPSLADCHHIAHYHTPRAKLHLIRWVSAH